MRKLLFTACLPLLAIILFMAVCISNAKANNLHPWYVSKEDYRHAKNALYWANRERFSDSLYHAKRAKDPLIQTIFEWMKYSRGTKDSSFNDITTFIKNHPNWPGQDRLELNAEKAIDENVSALEIIDWFTKEKNPDGSLTLKSPVSGKAKQHLAEALLKYKTKTGAQPKKIERLLKESWVESNFSSKEEKAFLKEHGKILNEKDYIDRLDRLLWDNKTASAYRILKKVDSDHQRLFKARIALLRGSPGVDNIVREVPKSLQGDEGLIYDRMKWRRARISREKAYELLEYAPPNPKYAEKWWKYKIFRIRDFIKDKKYKNAYDLAKDHGLESGVEFAEAEWIAGWLALRFLNMPQKAYPHFYTLYHGVKTPISLSRGAYWAGRAAEENGNLSIAKGWYKAASQHPNTFYGQLATIKLGQTELELPEQPTASLMDITNYHNNDLLKASTILSNLGKIRLSRRFISAGIRNSNSLGEVMLITRMGTEIGRPDYSVAAAKEVSRSGMIILDSHYPTIPDMKHARTQKPINEPEKALIHAIMLQESMLEQKAKSHAGALGLMQLMPATARSMAHREGVKYSKRKLTSSKDYNITLGSGYLRDMIKHFKGSYIMGIASYNAGPRNVEKWIKRNGDPRKFKNTDEIIDWMEKIPFSETRNYVQRVIENLQIYRYMLDKSSPPLVKTNLDIKR